MDREKFLENLMNYRIYDEYIDEISRAYEFGKKAHDGQKRKSGEPYFTHPIAVAEIIASWKLDKETVIAGLLHDVIEDTEYNYNDVQEAFGTDVANLVEGVTKLEKMKYNSKEEFQADNLRKMILSMAKDVRVVMIKLADRLHNIRTLKYQNDDRKKPIAQETIDIYAQFAHRLGMFNLKWELEDMSLLYLDEEKYYNIVANVNKKRSEREENIKQIIATLKEKMKEFDIEFIEIYGRPKNFYSIYKKMYKNNKLFSELYDITAIRIIVKEIKDCYAALGVVHTIWNPIQNRFKDYIATPKSNMYQSIHTTVIGKSILEPFEVQIRTQEMHEIAEHGIAAHFNYKHSNQKDSDMEKTLTWIRQMFEAEEDANSSKDYLDSIKYELSSDEIYVYTPNGKVIELPAGATPIDFAYKIHSDIGNRCIGAKVDGRMVPITSKLENGKVVEIITTKIANGPSRDWLNHAKSSQARNKIKHWFKTMRREENIAKGKEILDREIVKNGFKVKDFLKPEWSEKILSKLTVNSIDDLYASVGYGGILTNQIIPKLRELVREHRRKLGELEADEKIEEQKRVERREHRKSSNGVIVEGIGDTEVRLAKCCQPVPGDDIIGFVTRGRGVTVHQIGCTNLETSEEAKQRYIQVCWDLKDDVSSEKVSSSYYMADVQIIIPDRYGLLSDVAQVAADMDISVRGLNSRVSDDGVTSIIVSLAINNKNELNKIMNRFKKFDDVISVTRYRN